MTNKVCGKNERRRITSTCTCSEAKLINDGTDEVYLDPRPARSLGIARFEVSIEASLVQYDGRATIYQSHY